MNIFVLSDNPAEAAMAHNDKHVRKMILETAQLLSTAWHCASPGLIEWSPEGRPLLMNEPIYKTSHANHPCAIWARTSQGNYSWLWRLGTYLLDEYEFRWQRIHACAPVITALSLVPDIRQREMTDFVFAGQPELKVLGAVEAYRELYRTVKRPIAVWTRRKPPEWFY